MRRQNSCSRTSNTNGRKSSLHFQYESQVDASVVQHLRAVEESELKECTSSDQTVKTTNFHSYRMADSSLSGFAIPIFNLNLGRRDSKQGKQPENTQEAQCFFNLLEKFGGENERSISSNDFQEKQTINNRSSSNRLDDLLLKKENKIQSKSQFRSQHPSYPQEEELYDDRSGSVKKPSKMFRVAVTQTDNITPKIQRDQRNPSIRRHQFKREEKGLLEFKPFEIDESAIEERRYPLRLTREIGPLKYWLNQKIDYSKRGYWIRR